MPDGISLDAATGIISGTATEYGSFDVDITVTDANAETATQTLSLYVNAICGNGGYLITPEDSTDYTWGYTDGGLPAMTVDSGVTGFTDFLVTVTPENGHVGKEILLFVQMRAGVQIGIGYVKADFDAVDNAGAAFNAKPGDIIKVYIVDVLSSNPGQNPNIL